MGAVTNLRPDLFCSVIMGMLPHHAKVKASPELDNTVGPR